MGYIPPVRDEQSVLYGNRFDSTYSGIKAASPVVKGDFHGILADEEKEEFNLRKKREYKLNKLAKLKRSKNSKVIRDMTGKGYFVDEVV